MHIVLESGSKLSRLTRSPVVKLLPTDMQDQSGQNTTNDIFEHTTVETH